MPVPKHRGKVMRTRTKSLPGGRDYLRCEVMAKPGPRGGKTVCTKHRKKAKT